MISHVSFGVRDLAFAVRFYDAALAPLGYIKVWGHAKAVGYGVAGGDDQLALFARGDQVVAPGPGFHLAFDAPSTAAVDLFHQAALAIGGSDGGAPGLRPHYGAGYYAAFLIDPDGHKIEAKHRVVGAHS
jgi:catechol 2,3-dioxygenase-like lactoylglutathione lyase family enzyme